MAGGARAELHASTGPQHGLGGRALNPWEKRFQRFQYFLEPGEISVFLSPACWFISSRSRCEEDAVFCSLIILTPALTSI